MSAPAPTCDCPTACAECSGHPAEEHPLAEAAALVGHWRACKAFLVSRGAGDLWGPDGPTADAWRILDTPAGTLLPVELELRRDLDACRALALCAAGSRDDDDEGDDDEGDDEGDDDEGEL